MVKYETIILNTVQTPAPGCSGILCVARRDTAEDGQRRPFAKPTLYGYTYERKHCFRRRGAAGLAENAEVKINRLTMADASIGDLILQSGNIIDVAASYGIGDEIIGYDRIGNIQSLERRLKGTGLAYTEIEFYNYVYGNGTNRLTQATGMGGTATRQYTYDANGNVLSDDYRNITGTEYGRAAYTFHLDKGSPDIDYRYSIDDQRVFKREVSTSGNYEDYYLMDAMGKTVALRSSSNAGTNWEYYINGAEREARIVPNSTGSIQIEEKEPAFYLYDHLGNTRVVYQVDGYLDSVVTVNNIDFVADYFPYGKIVRKFVSGEEERYLTTQHERDEETGLDYRGARYYDSDVARFLSVDPLAAKALGWTPYRFCFDNPINYHDPDGRFETRKEARQYKKEHGIEGVIRKDADGGFNVSNKWTGQEWHKGTQWEREHSYTNDQGIVEGTIAVANRGRGNSKRSNTAVNNQSTKRNPDVYVGYYYEWASYSAMGGGGSTGTVVTKYHGTHTYTTDNTYNTGFQFKTELFSMGPAYGFIMSTGSASEVPLSAIEGISRSFELNASAVAVDVGGKISVSETTNENGDYLIMFGNQISIGVGTPFANGGYTKGKTNVY